MRERHAITMIVEPLPRMFVTGKYVLSKVFRLKPPQSADVVLTVDQPLTPQDIKDELGLDQDCTINISFDTPKLSLNVDYWIILPGLTIHSLDTRYSVSDSIFTTRVLDASDSIRFLSFSVAYPWSSVSDDLWEAINITEQFIADDPESAELLSLSYSDLPAKQLLHLAKRKKENSR